MADVALNLQPGHRSGELQSEDNRRGTRNSVITVVELLVFPDSPFKATPTYLLFLLRSLFYSDSCHDTIIA